MISKMNPTSLSCESLKDGALAINTTENLMLVLKSRYHALTHIEELYNAIHIDLDEKHTVLEQERKILKKQNLKLVEDMQKIKQQCTVLQKKLTEYNCVVDELKEIRRQNTELLIELSKYTSLSKESLSGPLKSMIRDMRKQGVGIKEIHIRIKRQINPDISYSTVRKYIAELESEIKE
ncbi:hypothetical protein FJQ98_09835 [Lysinibacillus agricola]|uniref:Uncharacterized protein n=1 Tax=Lysinibacillus agricola TaxID=2590012 RepID=A0ABX7AYX4_9BACI|nr:MULTISPECIES: hypothetical protein [Lysinibacillus]KOS64174.1 hypothetical protein AN161_02975 [Lysinibacillus sp. FJAT-14222]QQP14285.1 hypothetical protein FJQ98_09835 [Lysinibacillus agricola]